MADRRKLEITLRPGLPPLLKEVVIPEVDAIARAAWRAYEAGKVHLVQERLLPNVVAYLAVKRTTLGAMALEVKRGGTESTY